MKHFRRLIVVFASVAMLTTVTACGDDTSDDTADDTANLPDSRVQQLVSAEPYPRLEIHTDWVEQRRYRDDVAERLEEGLQEVVDKPDGVQVIPGEELAESAPESGWTFSQLREIVEPRAASADVSDGAIDAYTLFVDGEYADGSGDGTVLGIAWANRYSVLFRDSIEDACRNRLGSVPGIGDRLCANAELVIWRHELGHVLGLVDRGAPLTSDHVDPDADAHCIHDDCVMYRAFRRPGAVDAIQDRMDRGQSVPDFDDACLADLEAARSN